MEARCTDFESWIWVLIPLVAIVGAFASSIVATLAKARVRELEIRQRIAMIEKGLVPPPEVDPSGFDRAMGRYDAVAGGWSGRTESRSSGRHRRAGITLVGVGVGLMLLIGLAGGLPQEGLGVGGFVAIIGLAFFINSLFEAPHRPDGSAAAPSSASERPNS